MPHHLCSLYHCCDQIPEETDWKGGEALPLSQQFGPLGVRGRVERFIPWWPMNRDQDGMDQEHSLQRHLLTVCLTPMYCALLTSVSWSLPTAQQHIREISKRERDALFLGYLNSKQIFIPLLHFVWRLSVFMILELRTSAIHIGLHFFLTFFLLVVVHVYNIEEGCVVEKSFNVSETWNILGKTECFLFSIPNLRSTLKTQLGYYFWVSPLFILLCLM